MFERGKGNSQTELGRYRRSCSTCAAPEPLQEGFLPVALQSPGTADCSPISFPDTTGMRAEGEALTTGAWDQHTTGCVSYRSTSQILAMGAVLSPHAGVMLKHPSTPSPPLMSWFPMETHFGGMGRYSLWDFIWSPLTAKVDCR